MTHAASRDAQVPAARRDLFRIYAARAARGFGDGFAIIVLPAYLTEVWIRLVPGSGSVVPANGLDKEIGFDLNQIPRG